MRRTRHTLRHIVDLSRGASETLNARSKRSDTMSMKRSVRDSETLTCGCSARNPETMSGSSCWPSESGALMRMSPATSPCSSRRSSLTWSNCLISGSTRAA